MLPNPHCFLLSVDRDKRWQANPQLNRLLLQVWRLDDSEHGMRKIVLRPSLNFARIEHSIRTRTVIQIHFGHVIRETLLNRAVLRSFVRYTVETICFPSICDSCATNHWYMSSTIRSYGMNHRYMRPTFTRAAWILRIVCVSLRSFVRYKSANMGPAYRSCDMNLTNKSPPIIPCGTTLWYNSSFRLGLVERENEDTIRC